MQGNGDRDGAGPNGGADTVDVIQQFRHDLEQGKHWYIALLEAIGRWPLPEESFEGRRFRYLIADEAFDWLVLAERLCLEADSLIPPEEQVRLLFSGEPPLDLPPDQFRELIGPVKYRAYLNFLYGVTLEEALIQAVEQDVHKELMANCYKAAQRECEGIFERIYGAPQAELLARFREAFGREQSDVIVLDELKEFTYWLFKHRVRHCDMARVAADTRKALDHLRQQRELCGLRQQAVEPHINGVIDLSRLSQ